YLIIRNEIEFKYQLVPHTAMSEGWISNLSLDLPKSAKDKLLCIQSFVSFQLMINRKCQSVPKYSRKIKKIRSNFIFLNRRSPRKQARSSKMTNPNSKVNGFL